MRDTLSEERKEERRQLVQQVRSQYQQNQLDIQNRKQAQRLHNLNSDIISGSDISNNIFSNNMSCINFSSNNASGDYASGNNAFSDNAFSDYASSDYASSNNAFSNNASGISAASQDRRNFSGGNGHTAMYLRIWGAIVLLIMILILDISGKSLLGISTEQLFHLISRDFTIQEILVVE